jgi:predicted dehydrogenase
MEAGADVYLQKPISVDVVWKARPSWPAARKHGKVVQVGLQRRSTPHLVEAREQIVKRRQARQGGAGRDLLLLSHAGVGEPARSARPRLSRLRNLDRAGAAAALQPAGPSAGLEGNFKEYGNGIVGDMCVHMFDTTRWMLGLGWPKSVSSAGGIFMVDKGSKANISDTQTATFDYGDLSHRLAAPHLGPDPPDP